MEEVHSAICGPGKPKRKKMKKNDFFLFKPSENLQSHRFSSRKPV